jgi:hypothetical protein
MGKRSGLPVPVVIKKFSAPDLLGCPYNFHVMGNRIVSRGSSGQNVNLTTHLHSVTRLGMSGTIPLLLLHVFMAWKGKISNLYF